MILSDMIDGHLAAAIWECCDPLFIQSLQTTPLIRDVSLALQEDAKAYARKDPASLGDPVSIVQACTSFRAVLHYRMARALLERSQTWHLPVESVSYALLLASRGKLLSGADLHPRAQIGQRFVLDHGMGTVIGETSCLGDDCYVLGGVTLGASGISGNRPVKRHPSIGHRVQIGAFARIFGDVEIGDDVFIGPHCVIDTDLAAGSRVIVRSSLQITRNETRVTQSFQSVAR